MSDCDVEHMSTALKLAKYALENGETPVACVFVHAPTNKVIAYGMNATNVSISGTSHAEFMGIKQIQDKFGKNCAIFKEVVLYVTVEPCIMCASALKQLGLKKVVFGCGNERFGGNGSILKINSDTSTMVENKYLAVPGVLRKEAILLLRYFYVRENDKAPKPRTKKDRRLDKETFPPIQWSKYLDLEEFLSYFPDSTKMIYDAELDIFEDINWKLIDTEYGFQLLEDLRMSCERNAHEGKELCIKNGIN